MVGIILTGHGQFADGLTSSVDLNCRSSKRLYSRKF